MTNKWIKLGLSGLALASVLAAGAWAQGTHVPPRQARHGRLLQLSREQKEQALGVARAAQPLVRELRAQIRAERGQGRAHVKQLVHNMELRLQPEVRGLIATLTPEQRARLEQRAQRHGRTIDAARFERRLAYLLSRPGAAARIEKNLDR